MDPAPTTQKIFPTVFMRTAAGIGPIVLPLLAGVVAVSILGHLLSLLRFSIVGEQYTGLGFSSSIPELQEIARRLEQGDPTVQQETVAMLQGSVEAPDAVADDAFGMLGVILPFAVSLFFTCVVLAFSLTAFIVIALRDGGLLKSLLRAGRTLPSMFLLLLLVALQSLVFLWFLAPFAPQSATLLQMGALFCGILLLPRLLLAPVIHIAEHRGVFACFAESRRRTKGHWLAITLSALLVTSVLVLAFFLAAPAFLSIFEYISFGYILSEGLKQLLVAVFAVFLVEVYFALQTTVRSGR